MSVAKSVSQVSTIAKSKAPAKSKALAVIPAVAMYSTCESVSKAVTVEAIDYNKAVIAGELSADFEHGAIMALFAGVEIPTFKAFQESVKASNLLLPKASRKPVPNAKMVGFTSLYQKLNNLAKIREAESLGFNPLSYWNDKAITAKRETQPNIDYLIKGARKVINGLKPEATPMEIFEKGLKMAYKGALEFKNSKQAQTRLAKLLALASADGIILESETSESEAE
jgi:hypothetical protein